MSKKAKATKIRPGKAKSKAGAARRQQQWKN